MIILNKANITFIGTFLLLVQVVSLAQEKILTNNPAQDRYPNWSPDGSKIVFESDRDGNWEIYMMNADGTALQNLTDHESNDRSPSWHPDGNAIIFQSNRNDTQGIFMYILQNSRIEPISLEKFNYEPEWPRFSNDGSKIIFNAKTNENTFNLFIADKEGSHVEQLTFDVTRSLWGSFSPDDQSVLFFSRRDSNGEDDEIYIQELKHKKLTRLTNWPKHNFCPAWSPDGEKIVYATSMENSRPELYIMSKKGRDQTRITFNEDGDTEPSWSPDGNQIAFTGFRNGSYEICILDLEK
ncbi:DPP IV N-terminal domain-containing protein [Fulvivirgaceae bacterium BMA10]|uniref:DPP IV N-terminal domain-containing protein n=1 Tax=Splendidivirga corallicola TaxID=3051826 RepID=A0ABT8KQ71_9BACT|nr:DPP IV N-terminal domain-containing protein [Fulvivirgaceae bacterium BMA10]